MRGKGECFGRVVDRCESFVERRFAVALLFSEAFTFEPCTEGGAVAIDALGVALGQQVLIGDYRLDFALWHASGAKLAIELDGFEYHEKTRDQAEWDRVRDRSLLAAGWRTARYLGREVTRDALKVAGDAHRLFVGMVPALAAPAALIAPIRRIKGNPNVAAEVAACGDDWDKQLALMAEHQAAARARHGLSGAR